MRDKVLLKGHTPVLLIFAVIGIGWTVVISSLLTWNVLSIKRQTTAITLSQARSFFKQVVTNEILERFARRGLRACYRKKQAKSLP